MVLFYSSDTAPVYEWIVRVSDGKETVEKRVTVKKKETLPSENATIEGYKLDLENRLTGYSVQVSELQNGRHSVSIVSNEGAALGAGSLASFTYEITEAGGEITRDGTTLNATFKNRDVDTSKLYTALLNSSLAGGDFLTTVSILTELTVTNVDSNSWIWFDWQSDRYLVM